MMEIKSKLLNDAAWKDLAAKNKVKDNGLQKALEKLKRAGDDKYDEQEKALDEITKVIAALKKDKAVIAASAASKYLVQMQADAESAARDVTKSRSEHEKSQKAKADTEKKAAQAAQVDDEDDDELTPELLTTKLKPLLKMVAKGETMHALVAKSGKQVKVLLSRKPIPPARRKVLSDELGGGSTKFYPGVCALEDGAMTFALKAEVAGMSKLVKLALLEQTGLRLNKIKCRGEDGDDHDDDETERPIIAATSRADEQAQAGPATVSRMPPAASAAGTAQAAKPPLGTAATFAPGGSAGAAPLSADLAGDDLMPQLPAVDMPDEDIAAEIMDKQLKILDSWKSALKIFFTTMTSSADAEAKPNYQNAMISYVTDKLIGEMVKRAPGMSEINALAKAMEGEYKRAAAASASATLRDFVNQQERAVDSAGRAIVGQRNAFIAAVRTRRVAAGIDERGQPAGSAKGGKGGGKGGHVEVNPPQLEAWSMMRMNLMDMLDAVNKVYADSTAEKLMKVLSEGWIAQGTTYAGMGQRVPAVIIIRLNPDRSLRNAHIEGSGGQKLAEELLKEFPEGVDVFGFNTRRRVVHYADNGWPQTTLELDANNRDLSRGALIEGDTGGLYKYVMSHRLPPTKELTGD